MAKRRKEAPKPLVEALDARDLDAFRAQVDTLQGPVDDYQIYERPIVAWVSRQGWGPGTP